MKVWNIGGYGEGKAGGRGGRGRGGGGGLREEGSTTVASGNGQLLRGANLLSSTLRAALTLADLGESGGVVVVMMIVMVIIVVIVVVVVVVVVVIVIVLVVVVRNGISSSNACKLEEIISRKIKKQLLQCGS